MAHRLYLSMIPEALVASMLPPREFGSYLAVGTRKRTRGQSIFVEVAPDFQSDFFPLGDVATRCVPHPDGQPKHSVYLGIYRALEHIPRSVARSLFLVTPDGRVLELPPAAEPPTASPGLHLYQEICPVHPRIASTLSPEEFVRFITGPSRAVHVPRLCFVQLRLGALAQDPEGGKIGDLPYSHLDHLRDCLTQLSAQPDKHTKTVDRIQPQTCPYRAIETGFFIGDQEGLTYYAFPSPAELERDHHDWWRSASV